MGVKRQKLCKICGQPIPDDVAMRLYCYPECKKKDLRPTGPGALTAEVVIKAIQDIRAVSLEDVRRYEDPDYWAKWRGHIPNRAMNYLTAKKFLLSKWFDTFCSRLSGKDIYNKLIREKEED